jgi:hypothetical protein
MATSKEVLEFLRPNGGWTIYGDEFDSILYEERCQPITKEEFDAGFSKADKALEKMKIEQEKLKESKRAKLLALGLTQAEIDA